MGTVPSVPCRPIPASAIPASAIPAYAIPAYAIPRARRRRDDAGQPPSPRGVPAREGGEGPAEVPPGFGQDLLQPPPVPGGGGGGGGDGDGGVGIVAGGGKVGPARSSVPSLPPGGPAVGQAAGPPEEGGTGKAAGEGGRRGGVVVDSQGPNPHVAVGLPKGEGGKEGRRGKRGNCFLSFFSCPRGFFGI